MRLTDGPKLERSGSLRTRDVDDGRLRRWIPGFQGNEASESRNQGSDYYCSQVSPPDGHIGNNNEWLMWLSLAGAMTFIIIPAANPSFRA